MHKQTGFTLIEIAVVLVIVGFLVGGLLGPLSLQVEVQRIKTTQQFLTEVKEELIGYVLVNQRLPCPASADSNGAEEFVAGAGNSLNGGQCSRSYGFLPAQTLGISGLLNEDGLLVDIWGNPYRYNISNTAATPTAPVDCTGISEQWALTTRGKIAEISSACLEYGFKMCADASCGQYLATRIPVVIFSMGKNWAIQSQTEYPMEWENIGGSMTSSTGRNYFISSNQNFVFTAYNAQDTTQRFDDIVVWLSPNILYNRMVTAGIYP